MPAVHLHGDKTKQVRQATRRVTLKSPSPDLSLSMVGSQKRNRVWLSIALWWFATACTLKDGACDK